MKERGTDAGAWVETAARWNRDVPLGSEPWQVIRTCDLAPGEDCFANSFLIQAEIGYWRRDPLLWTAVLEMYRAAFGYEAPVGHVDEDFDWLEQQVADAFEDGILVLVRPRWDRLSASADSSDGTAPAFSLKNRKSRGGDKKGQSLEPKKTWVEIKLVDQNGNAVPHERYRITLPDGRVQEGNLDEHGWMRESGLDPGDCVITFPDIHQDEWDPE